MATATRIQEEYLSCSICMEPYREPKLLPCAHTFCRKCLRDYILNRTRKDRRGDFPCPICREVVTVPSKEEPVEEWVDQFRTNVHLIGILDNLRPVGEGGVTGELSGEEKEARLKAILTQVRSQRFSAETIMQESVRHLEKLRLEKEEAARALEAAVEEMVEAVRQRGAQLLMELDKRMTERERAVLRQDESCQEVLASLDHCSELAQCLLLPDCDAEVQVTVEAMERRLGRTAGQLEEEVARHGRLAPLGVSIHPLRLQQFHVMLASIHTPPDPLSPSPDTPQSPPSPTSPNLKGLPSEGASSPPPGLGGASGQGSGTGGQDSKPTCRLLKRVNCQVPEDKKEPAVNGLIVLPNGTLVLLDWRNRCVKARQTTASPPPTSPSTSPSSPQTRTMRLHLKTNPYSLTMLKEDKVVVSSQQCLYLVGVKDSLLLEGTVKLAKDYVGLTALDDNTLAGGNDSSSCVDIFNLDGKVLKTIKKDSLGKPLFSWPRFLACTRTGRLLVSDWQRKSLTCLVVNGTVHFRFPPRTCDTLAQPNGVCCDSQGHVFLVDTSAKKVYVLSGERKTFKEVLNHSHGLSSPWAIATDSHNAVFISNGKEVLIYEITFR